MTDSSVPTLTEVRANLALLSQSLPTGVDPLSMKIGDGKDITRSRSPTVALCYREAQAWRLEEFMRAACDLLERGDLVASVASTRHAAECCAGVWYLLEQIERAIKEDHDPADLHDQIVRLFVGTKLDEKDMPKAINVLTFLDKLDRKIPGFVGTYQRLSEVAHPNWAGSAAIFSNRDSKTLITHFGKNLRDTSYVRRLNLRCMLGSLEIFSYAYNLITDLMPDFCEACERGIVRREQSERPAP
jgi:hypothetical protein